MWLVIRWILLPLAVGRRIHPSIGEFKRFKRIRSKKLSEAALGPWAAPLGDGDPRRFRKSFDRSLNRLNSPIKRWIRRPTANGRRIHRIANHM